MENIINKSKLSFPYFSYVLNTLENKYTNASKDYIQQALMLNMHIANVEQKDKKINCLIYKNEIDFTTPLEFYIAYLIFRNPGVICWCYKSSSPLRKIEGWLQHIYAHFNITATIAVNGSSILINDELKFTVISKLFEISFFTNSDFNTIIFDNIGTYHSKKFLDVIRDIQNKINLEKILITIQLDYYNTTMQSSFPNDIGENSNEIFINNLD